MANSFFQGGKSPSPGDTAIPAYDHGGRRISIHREVPNGYVGRIHPHRSLTIEGTAHMIKTHANTWRMPQTPATARDYLNKKPWFGCTASDSAHKWQYQEHRACAVCPRRGTATTKNRMRTNRHTDMLGSKPALPGCTNARGCKPTMSVSNPATYFRNLQCEPQGLPIICKLPLPDNLRNI